MFIYVLIHLQMTFFMLKCFNVFLMEFFKNEVFYVFSFGETDDSSGLSQKGIYFGFFF